MEVLGKVREPKGTQNKRKPSPAGEDQFIGALIGAAGQITGNVQQRKMQKEDQKFQREVLQSQKDSETNAMVNGLLQAKLEKGTSTQKSRTGLYVGIGASVLVVIALMVFVLVNRGAAVRR